MSSKDSGRRCRIRAEVFVAGVEAAHEGRLEEAIPPPPINRK
jgi:hypothetical protein